MNNEAPVLSSLTESVTDVPVSAGHVDSYVLLLVLLSVFAAGTLLLLSLLLLFCHRCCASGRRYSRASDDLEKTNTTYAEDSQPTQDVTVRLDESDALSASSCPDGESERFVSAATVGRRVSFNESALFEQERTTQEKGRRYTLTEGDFHHLKKARLTHLHLPPAPCDLKILTIMECDSAESSSLNVSESSAPKPTLAIYQLTERGTPAWKGQSVSGGLPGDAHHSIVLQSPRKCETQRNTHTVETFGHGTETQTSVLQFFSKLRRHTSLEGAGPYFRRWKFDTSHRAASLDAKGSPKRRPVQRQRAASETTEQSEDLSSPRSAVLQSLSAESLSHPDTSSVFLCRFNLEATEEVNGSRSPRKEAPCVPVNGTEEDHEKENSERENIDDVYDDSLSAAARDAGLQEQFEEMLRNAEDPKTEKYGNSVERQKTEMDVEDVEELVMGAGARTRTDSGSSFSFMIRQESLEAPPSLYRDIWSLRASLEQYASSDQSSTDRESIRSDGDSVSSLGGGAGGRPGLDCCLSQDLDDEPEGEGEGSALSETGGGTGGEGEGGNRKLLQMDSGYASIEAPSKAPEEMRLFGAPGAPRGKTASERRLFFTSSRKKGSVCESVEARLFQEELEDKMGDGTETELKPKEQPVPGSKSPSVHEPQHHPLKSLHPQKAAETQAQLVKSISQPSSPHCPRLRRRDYSIDEKTDALFNEFLRHDPRFDQQDSPYRSRHRSRVHLRKQWQRHKQYSDPGTSTGGRYSPSLERQRFSPLRRGDSAGYPLDTRYHSTLSRIASAADEEASEEASKERGDGPDRTGGGALGSSALEEGRTDTTNSAPGPESTSSPTASSEVVPMSRVDPRVDNKNNNSSHVFAPEVALTLTDKLAARVEQRLYGSLRGPDKLQQGSSPRALMVANTTATKEASAFSSM